MAVQTQIRELEKLQVKGEYTDKLLNTGFEWDMPGLDHASVGILDENGEASVSGIHAFEWLFARVAPLILIMAIVGIFLTRKKP